MMHSSQVVVKCGRNAAALVLVMVLLAGLGLAGKTGASPEAERLIDLLARTASQTSEFLDQFSEVKCTEQVRQEKLGKDDKVELKEDSTYALALRGREYPLELSGTAWIDPQTGIIAKIEAGIADTLQDVGLKALSSEIHFAPVPFSDSKQVYWFPRQARVEVETARQHWRNLHQFTAYKKFTVSTEEQVTQK